MEGNFSRLVEGIEKIYAFDGLILAEIVVPADKLALVGVGLLLYGVVGDRNALLELAHQRFHQTQQFGGIQILLRKEAGDLVVAYGSAAHRRETGSVVQGS